MLKPHELLTIAFALCICHLGCKGRHAGELRGSNRPPLINDLDSNASIGSSYDIRLYFMEYDVNEQDVQTVEPNCAIFVQPEDREPAVAKDSAAAQINSLMEAEADYYDAIAREALDSLHVKTIETTKRFLRLKGPKEWLFDIRRNEMGHRHFLLLFASDKVPLILWRQSLYMQEVRSYFGIKRYAELPVQIVAQQVPDSFKQAFAFLELIKAHHDSSVGHGIAASTTNDYTELFKSHLSKMGVYFYDPDRFATGQYCLDSIMQQVRLASGKAYDSFEHLASWYSIPYRQSSELIFLRRGDSYVVLVANNHKLTFIIESGQLKLTRLECLWIEGC
jgi:hypothetical protein